MSGKDEESTDGVLYKILILGNPKTGKTSLVRCSKELPFDHKYLPTMGVDVEIKEEFHEKERCSFELWCCSGNRMYLPLAQQLYSDIDGICVLYDITDSDSLDATSFWLNEAARSCPNKPSYLIGTKSDKVDSFQVTIEQVEQIADEYDIKQIQVSSKTGNNVDELFEMLLKDIRKN